ncbi:MAG: Ldh family oxidoreductase [Chloroflexota bacterium]
MPIIHHATLNEFTTSIFAATGLPEEQAQTAANHLVESNLMGHPSHGVMHVPGYTKALLSGGIQPVGGQTIVRQTPVSQVIDANRSFGVVYTYETMQTAVNIAKEHTIGAVAVHRSSHIGRLGAYPIMAAAEDCIGIVMLNGGGRFAAPFGGTERRLPPNPIAISVPTFEGPALMLDITTSMVAGGKVAIQAARGEPIPDDWVVDVDGNPVTDAQRFYGNQDVAMLPLGGLLGHKGYGLAVMIDAIAGGLSWAGCSTEAPTRGGSGYLALAIKVDSFIDIDEYKGEIQKMVEWLRSSRTMPGVEQVYLPGELEAIRQRRQEEEGIDIEESTWGRIVETANEVGVAVPSV